jgi:hypothetical protein
MVGIIETFGHNSFVIFVILLANSGNKGDGFAETYSYNGVI